MHVLCPSYQHYTCDSTCTCISQSSKRKLSVTNREAITDYGYFSDEAKKYRNEAQITQFRTHTTFALFVEHLMNTSYTSKFT